MNRFGMRQKNVEKRQLKVSQIYGIKHVMHVSQEKVMQNWHINNLEKQHHVKLCHLDLGYFRVKLAGKMQNLGII